MTTFDEMVAAMPEVGERIQYALDNVGRAAIANSDALAVAVVVFVAALIMWVALHAINTRKPVDEAEEMRKRLELDAMYADAFGDKLFEMLCNDKIDRHEYKRACRRFGIAYRLNDLLTRKNPKRGLRFRVLHHIAEIHNTVPTLSRKGEPRKLGPHPSTDHPAAVLVIKPAVVQRKVWLVAGKALRRKQQ
jgi:hypothetical protein